MNNLTQNPQTHPATAANKLAANALLAQLRAAYVRK